MITMPISKGVARILVVGDTPAFGKTVGAILEGEAEKGWRIRHVTYEGFQGLLSARLLRETDLFVLDLWRSYPTGLRAEGVAVTEELGRQRCRCLIVSPLSLELERAPRRYWDLACGDSLPSRCRQILSGRVMPEDLSEIKRVLGSFLRKPEGHQGAGTPEADEADAAGKRLSNKSIAQWPSCDAVSE